MQSKNIIRGLGVFHSSVQGGGCRGFWLGFGFVLEYYSFYLTKYLKKFEIF